MQDLDQEISEWADTLVDFHLPRWDELPDLELYMDQVITLIDKYISPIIQTEKHPLLTASMVNNYVKKELIPPPEKKRYTRKHVAFLVAITLLKQILTIQEIKEGILFQGQATGIRNAYNLFCEEQERAVQKVCLLAMGKPDTKPQEAIKVEFLAVKAATAAFANKLLAEKTVEVEKKHMDEQHKSELSLSKSDRTSRREQE